MRTSGYSANDKMHARVIAGSQKAITRQYDGGSIRRVQNARIRSLLKHAYIKCDFYREQFARYGFDLKSLLERGNFARLPFLTKHDLNVQIARIIVKDCKPLDLFKCIRGLTSGTTGVPVLVFFDKSIPIQAHLELVRFLHNNHIEIEPNSTAVLNVVEFPGLNSYYFTMPTLKNSYYYRINLSAERWKNQESLLDFLNDLQPALVEGRPTPLAMLADVIDFFRHNKRFQPKAIVSYGETLHENVRNRLSNSFRAEVYDSYGITEVGGRVGIECKWHNGFHLFSENFLVEIIDEEGRPLDRGQVGEVVITSLVNRIMPIIRYRTGDRASLCPHECGCGIKHPLLNLVEGRVVNLFVGKDGNRFNPYLLGQLVDELPVVQYQIVQEDFKKVSIRYIPREVIAEGAWREVLQRIMERLGDDCQVDIAEVDRFETKEKTFQKFLCWVKSQ